MNTCVIAVQCYGVDPRPRTNEQYRRYADDIITWVLEHCEQKTFITIIFAGGMTNPSLKRMSEAACMETAFVQVRAQSPTMRRYHVETLTVADPITGEPKDLIEAQRMLAMEPRIDVLFCNWSRQDRVRWLAKRLLPGVKTIVTSNFDQRGPLDRLREQQGNIVTRLAYHSPWFRRRVQMPMRRRFMEADAIRRAGGG